MGLGRCVRRLGPVLAAVLALCGPARAGCFVGLVTKVPLTQKGRELRVPVSMNGEQGDFILDTGTTMTTLAPPFAGRAKVSLDINASGSDVNTFNGYSAHSARMGFVGALGESLPVNMARAHRIDVGTINFNDWEFAVLPKEAGGVPPIDADGLLGMDFLHYFDIDLDLEAGTMTLWHLQDCTDIHPEWHTDDYVAIPLQHTAGQRVTMPIYIDGAFLNVLLDTGAGGVWLTHDAAIKAGATDATLAADLAPNQTGGARGVGSAKHTFKQLLLGKSVFDNAVVRVATPNNHLFEQADGLIGWKLLSARKIWLSYTTNTLFVQMNSQTAAPISAPPSKP